MAAIVEVVQAFLREMEWNWEQIDEHRLRVLVGGEAGRWLWTACWNAEDTLFVSYSTCSFKVPPKRRSAVAEFLAMANYGLKLGNFELDLDDGEVRFKLSVPVPGGQLSRLLVRDLAFCGFSRIDRYIPSLMTVAFGTVSPRKAIKQAELPPKPQPANDPEDHDLQGNPGCDRAKRVAQIVNCLRRMKNRAINEAKARSGFVLANYVRGPTGSQRDRGAEAAGSRSVGTDRMLQFCFEDEWFAIDIPNTYIVTAEARKLLGERQGFYREAEKPDAGVSDVVTVVEFDPVGKRYTYGQEQEAAEDAVWILFDLWKLPAGRPIYASAASPKTGIRWERDQLLQ